jgi:peptide-methionine (S)-S-oxide reductase
MKNSEITDPLFREAVEAIDAGNTPVLEQLLDNHPRLLHDRLDVPTEGYFRQPYLLWFVADNPIRNKKLPANIAEITRTIIRIAKREGVNSLQLQLDYTLGLVVTGSTPRDCGVQIELMDLIIDAGAKPGRGHGALAHGNTAAAEHLVERGGELTLATAICLERSDDAIRLAQTAGIADRQVALTAAAFYGKTRWLSFLIELGVDPGAYLQASDGFHSHATALHQAVCSGSLDSVKVLVEAGAKLDAKDTVYHGTPLGWAGYMQTEEPNDDEKKKYAAIEAYLSSKEKG